MFKYNDVAPFTGAWIEILDELKRIQQRIVAPFTGAWIEIADVAPANGLPQVAPFTGAWIEILLPLAYIVYLIVAPFTGAWIEMRLVHHIDGNKTSLPSRERGLKFSYIDLT